mgnify:FL=1
MTVVCRGLRGATTVSENTKESIIEATTELLNSLVEANSLKKEDLAASFFTTTMDLNSEFPAVAARQIGWGSVPLMNSHEMNVPGSLQKCIRVMLLVNTSKGPEEMNHLYLRGAKVLRPDITGANQ